LSFFVVLDFLNSSFSLLHSGASRRKQSSPPSTALSILLFRDFWLWLGLFLFDA
jgi:hypothetical protein